MVPLKEFLDYTDEIELQLYCENIVFADKTERECARTISYYNLLPNLKKGSNKTPEKILPLITDEYDIYKLEQKFEQSDYEETKEKLDRIKESINLDDILSKNKNIE